MQTHCEIESHTYEIKRVAIMRNTCNNVILYEGMRNWEIIQLWNVIMDITLVKYIPNYRVYSSNWEIKLLRYCIKSQLWAIKLQLW